MTQAIRSFFTGFIIVALSNLLFIGTVVSESSTKDIPKTDTTTDTKDIPKDKKKSELTGIKALDISLISTTAFTLSPFITTTYSRGSAEESKIILAKNDAASFVATNGKIKGAYLQSALILLRNKQLFNKNSDIELAYAIINYKNQ